MIYVRQSTVQIYDTDASGLIFFGAPMRWFAQAEEEFLRESGLGDVLGYDPAFDEAGPQAPTRAVELSLDLPLRFRDRFEQRTWISRVGTTSYDVSHQVVAGGRCCVRGTVHRVMVVSGPDGTLVPVPVPTAVRGFVVEVAVAGRVEMDVAVDQNA